MSDDLIQEMSTRLGRTAPEVEKAFAAFASALQDRVRSDGEANLAGLGVIRSEAGGPRFEPSEALFQAVNYRWLSAGAPIAAASGRPEVALSVVPAASMSAETSSVEPLSDEEVIAESPAPTPEPSDLVSEAASLAAALEVPATDPENPTDSDDSAPISVDLSPELLEEPPMPDDQKPIRKVSWAPIGEVDPTDLAGLPTTPAETPAPTPPAAASANADGGAAEADNAAAAPPPPPVEAFMPPAPPTPEPPASVPTPTPEPPASVPPPTSPGQPEDALVDDLTYETLHKEPVASAGAAASAVAGAAGAGAAAAAVRSSKAGSRRSTPGRRSGSDEPSNRKPLFIILGLLAIVAVGWILINQFGGAANGTDPAVAETENATANPVAGSEEPEVDPGGDPSDPAAGAQTAQQPPPEAASAGATLDPSSSGYTLIVGSSLSRSGAEADMNRFRNLGHPVAVLSYPDGDGQTRHRIAVGEFATTGAADSARRAMASRLPDGTWVRRIRR